VLDCHTHARVGCQLQYGSCRLGKDRKTRKIRKIEKIGKIGEIRKIGEIKEPCIQESERCKSQRSTQRAQLY
jgi:hypothetical protein